MRSLIYLFLLLPFALSAQLVPATVKAVHDGDSYKVQYRDTTTEWIRLWAADAPEVVSNHISRNQAYGVQAGEFARKLLKGKEVLLDTLYRDQYNRLVCEVYADTGKINVTLLLIATGNAWYYNDGRIPKAELDALKALQKEAKDAKLGLWGLPGREIRPSTFRGRHRR
jgi:endonuclease YncB( thermonuclease family)